MERKGEGDGVKEKARWQRFRGRVKECMKRGKEGGRLNEKDGRRWRRRKEEKNKGMKGERRKKKRKMGKRKNERMPTGTEGRKED